MYYYDYSGPVIEFGKCITNEWQASTYAISEKKAISNLAYQYKKDNNRLPNANIALPGTLNMR